MPANLLKLPAYIVTDIQETDHDYHINAETKSAPQTCQNCSSDNLVGFGRNEQLVWDLPIHGKRVGINPWEENGVHRLMIRKISIYSIPGAR